jgi:hypothetical protein
LSPTHGNNPCEEEEVMIFLRRRGTLPENHPIEPGPHALTELEVPPRPLTQIVQNMKTLPGLPDLASECSYPKPQSQLAPWGFGRFSHFPPRNPTKQAFSAAQPVADGIRPRLTSCGKLVNRWKSASEVPQKSIPPPEGASATRPGKEGIRPPRRGTLSCRLRRLADAKRSDG